MIEELLVLYCADTILIVNTTTGKKGKREKGFLKNSIDALLNILTKAILNIFSNLISHETKV